MVLFMSNSTSVVYLQHRINQFMYVYYSCRLSALASSLPLWQYSRLSKLSVTIWYKSFQLDAYKRGPCRHYWHEKTLMSVQISFSQLYTIVMSLGNIQPRGNRFNHTVLHASHGENNAMLSLNWHNYCDVRCHVTRQHLNRDYLAILFSLRHSLILKCW